MLGRKFICPSEPATQRILLKILAIMMILKKMGKTQKYDNSNAHSKLQNRPAVAFTILSEHICVLGPHSKVRNRPLVTFALLSEHIVALGPLSKVVIY